MGIPFEIWTQLGFFFIRIELLNRDREIHLCDEENVLFSFVTKIQLCNRAVV